MSTLLFGPKTELGQMLDGRERRAAFQKEMLSRNPGAALVCFTVNAPGAVKVNAVTEIIFAAGLKEIRNAVPGTEIFEEQVLRHSYGHEACFAINREAALRIKTELTRIEDSHPIGRLFDIDVICREGSEIKKISRGDIGRPARSCLLCGQPASECASTRAHSVAGLCERMKELVTEYTRQEGTDRKTVVRALAYTAMLAEVATTPKPGLVDAANNGSHRDMTPETFEKSAAAIEDYFAGCFRTGEEIAKQRATESKSDKEKAGSLILDTIRPLGIKAEEDMLRATDGVNTHKGMIFSLGIICAAYGYSGASANTAAVLAMAAQIAAPTLKDFEKSGASRTATPGERQHAQYGISGIRGEAAAGFPSIREYALPAYRQALDAGLSCNDAGVLTLLRLISCVRDSNMISRGGLQLAQEMSIMAGHLVGAWRLAERVDPRPDALIAGAKKLDEMFIKRNLSPGGCADMLAITYFMEMMRELYGEAQEE